MGHAAFVWKADESSAFEVRIALLSDNLLTSSCLTARHAFRDTAFNAELSEPRNEVMAMCMCCACGPVRVASERRMR